jgi:hypothetical protein
LAPKKAPGAKIGAKKNISTSKYFFGDKLAPNPSGVPGAFSSTTQGPDGLYYQQNMKGQLIPITPELQDILQKQQQSGLQKPLIKTVDGNIYQQGILKSF